MLAEPKPRRKPWSLNPNGKNWSDDNNKFGQKMLEKMGWTPGKGLGKNEDGNPEHIRVSFKDDRKGVGCKVDNDSNWIGHTVDFNELLANLQDAAIENEKETTDDKGVQDLEKRTKAAKGPMYFHKFIRGKDLSKRSEKDMRCIFGTNKESLNEVEAEPKAAEVVSSVPTTTSTMSIQEYFSRKILASKSNGISGLNGTDIKVETNDNQDESPENLKQYDGDLSAVKTEPAINDVCDAKDNKESRKKKKKSKKHKSEHLQNDENAILEKGHKRKRVEKRVTFAEFQDVIRYEPYDDFEESDIDMSCSEVIVESTESSDLSNGDDTDDCVQLTQEDISSQLPLCEDKPLKKKQKKSKRKETDHGLSKSTDEHCDMDKTGQVKDENDSILEVENLALDSGEASEEYEGPTEQKNSIADRKHKHKSRPWSTEEEEVESLYECLTRNVKGNKVLATTNMLSIKGYGHL